MIIRNVDEDKAGEITATMGTYSWDYGSGGIEADAPHPLEMQIIATIARAPQIIELVFKGKEIGYSVHRWVKDADYDDFDTVETVDNTITLPDDDESYIYEVIVEYKKGTVHYAFQVGK